MSDTPFMRPTADRNLLFGILALQIDFISRDALIKAMNAWVLEKSKSLGQILGEHQALDRDVQRSREDLSRAGDPLPERTQRLRTPDCDVADVRRWRH